MGKLDNLREHDIEGTVFTEPSFEDAIVGYTMQDNVVYDYDKMIVWLMDKYQINWEEAASFIDENTLRSIPYAPEPRPIIMFKLEDYDAVN